MRATSSFVYIARYRFGNMTKAMLAAGVLIGVAGLLFLPGDAGIFVAAGGFALTATLLAIYLPMQLRGVTGLRVDETGIFFGGRPMVYKWTSTFVPWEKISEVYLFRVLHLGLRATYVGLQGSSPDDEPMAPVIPLTLVDTIWHVPVDVVKASRPAYGWQLDKAAFTAAVNYFAPTVTVVDLTAALPIQLQKTQLNHHPY